MKSSILVDTSVWIEFFNQPDSLNGEALEQLLLENRVVYAGIILTELLQGAKIEQEFEDILNNMKALPFLETTHKTWVSAGKISYSLHRKGITIPVTDIVIASLSLDHNCPVFTLDPHFEIIPGLKSYSAI
ncbi:MAG: PIN domain-containing protein [SAR324 cluster bacterium]|nr:PIN domain-containing protein [SAR324 cluster bacterium]